MIFGEKKIFEIFGPKIQKIFGEKFQKKCFPQKSSQSITFDKR
jgi:hypothetical protein